MTTHKLMCRWASTAGIFMLAIVPFTSGADAGASIRVVATLAEPAGSVIHHLSGDALPLGANYRIVLSPDTAASLTVEAQSASGERDRLFTADHVIANRSIVLPSDGAWYPAPPKSQEFRIVATLGEAVTEHVIRSLQVAPMTEAGLIEDWLKQGEARGSSPPSVYPFKADLNELYERAAIYRGAAIRSALAKEPTIRGGPGVTIFRAAAPAVVLINTDKGNGSGIVISQRGDVLTNWHVIDGAKFVAIVTKPPAGQRLSPGDVYEAKVLKYDEVADLALVQFQRTPPNLALLRTGDERSLEVGSSVHAIGHPEGQQWSYTQGIISQVRSNYRWKDKQNILHTATVIQTQTPINHGSSGGPLLDDNAAVLGITAMGGEGINFAISVGEIKRFLEMRENRVGRKQAPPPPDPQPGCKQRQLPPFIDAKTKKPVAPFDTLCLGRANKWLVGDPPEYVIFDRMGDGKIDLKVVLKFAPDVDLWIVYESRDGIPTMFGYDYGRQGKPDRWVSVGPPHQ
jgi:hypothetical protein